MSLNPPILGNVPRLRGAVASVLIACTPWLADCRRQQMSVDGHDVRASVDKLKSGAGVVLPGGTNPVGTPIDLPDALTAARSYVQSRSVITLDIKDSEVVPGAAMRLLNDTTHAELMTSASSGLLDGSGDDVFLSAEVGYDFVLRIYPMTSAFAGKFSYGTNKLRLVVEESDKALAANRDITLHDFNFLSMGTSSFAAPMQSQAGLQVQIDTSVGPVAANGFYALTMGAVDLPNW